MHGHQREVAPLKAHDPARLGRHRLLGRLGAGGMGVVYLGEGPLGKVAVKVVRDELATDPGFRLRFQREVQACFRVSGQWTARLLDFDTTADQPWLATEFIDAPDLQQVIDVNGPMPADLQLRVALALAKGLESLHAFELVHRDLKPSNVLFPTSGPKIIDFGIASALEDIGSLTGTSNILGSPAWMAPEQILLGETGMPSDIYAWGALMAFIASGTSLSGSSLPKILANAAAETSAIDLEPVAPELRPSVAAALDREPLSRPTAEQLVASLESLPALAPEPGTTAGSSDETRWVIPTPPFIPTSRKKGRGKAIAAGAAAVVVAAGVTIAVILGSGHHSTAAPLAKSSTPPTSSAPPRSASAAPTTEASPSDITTGKTVAFQPITAYDKLLARLPTSVRVTCSKTTSFGSAAISTSCRIGDEVVRFSGFATLEDLNSSIGFGDNVPTGCAKGLTPFMKARQTGGYNGSYTDGAHFGLVNCGFDYSPPSGSFTSISWTNTPLSIAGFMSNDTGDEAGYQSLYQKWLRARHFAS